MFWDSGTSVGGGACWLGAFVAGLAAFALARACGTTVGFPFFDRDKKSLRPSLIKRVFKYQKDKTLSLREIVPAPTNRDAYNRHCFVMSAGCPSRKLGAV